MNLANQLTILRIVLIIPFIYFLFGSPFLNLSLFQSRAIALILFFIASMTDMLDGYIARHFKQNSTLGGFLDPLADKILVLSALTSFWIIDTSIIPIWMLCIISIREIMITIVRTKPFLSDTKTNTFKTESFGKWKTFIQDMSIGTVLFLITLQGLYPSYESSNLTEFIQNYFIMPKITMHIPYLLMLLTTLVSVLSALLYGKK